VSKLKNVVIADPVESVAVDIARCCAAFSERAVTATTREQALSLSLTVQPEMLIVALELLEPDALAAIDLLRSAQPQACIVLTFRELAVSTFAQLRQLNVADVLPQPIDASALLRVVWQRFKISTRRYPRYQTTLDVLRPDGELLGRTRNVSQGGLLMDVVHPIAGGDSLLVDLILPAEKPLRVRARVLAAEGEVPCPMWARLQFDSLRGLDTRRLAEFLARLELPDTKPG